MPKRRSESNRNQDNVKVVSKNGSKLPKTTTAGVSAFAKYSSEPKQEKEIQVSPQKKKNSKVINEPTISLISPNKPFMVNSEKEVFTSNVNEEILHSEDPSVECISLNDAANNEKVNGGDSTLHDMAKECDSIKILSLSEDRSQIILGIKESYNKVKVYGRGYVKVLKGCLDILGHLLNSESEEIEYFAPVTHCALVFQPTCHNSGKSKKLHLSEIVDYDDKDLSESFADILENFDVVLLLTKSSDDDLSLSGYPDIYKVRINDGEIIQELSSGSYIMRTEKYFECFPGYQSTCDEILSYAQEFQNHKSLRNPIVITAGGKNAGKSTFNRYLINRLLQKFPKIYYLECDIGQPEFTPPGFISVSSVTSPILGPPFTHVQDHDFSVYYGNINAAGEPDRYIQSVKHVFDNIASSNIPVIVNTMGWIRALGLNLLVDTVKIVQPTHFVQISSEKQSRYLSVLDKNYLQHAEGWLMNECQIQDFNHSLMEIDIKSSEITMYNPSDLRNLRLLAYLNKLIRICCKRDKISMGSRSHYSLLCSVRPYSVKLSDVLLCVAHETGIPKTRSLSVFNASLVSLSNVDEQFMKNNDNDKYLPQPPVCQSVGLGIVRSVDAEDGILYVISHLPESVLKKVNCLTLGILNIPECMYQQHAKEGNSLPPYVTEDFPFQVTGSSKFRVYRSFANKTP